MEWVDWGGNRVIAGWEKNGVEQECSRVRLSRVEHYRMGWEWIGLSGVEETGLD